MAQQNLYQLARFYHSMIYTLYISYLYFYSKDHEIKTLLHASNVKIMLSEKIVCSVYSVCSCCNELYTCETSLKCVCACECVHARICDLLTNAWERTLNKSMPNGVTHY